MPDKSRRRKGKYSPQSKRRKGRPTRSTTVVQQRTVAQAREPVPIANVSASAAGAPAPVAKPVPVRYQYIATELRTIGILAGIMLIILIVLAFVPLPW